MRLKTLEFLEAHKSEMPSKWREEAEWRRENASWLRHSQRIAVQVLLKMNEAHLSQKALAERMNCTQQFVSKILNGKENLSLEIMSRLEDALQVNILLDMQSDYNMQVAKSDSAFMSRLANIRRIDTML